MARLIAKRAFHRYKLGEAFEVSNRAHVAQLKAAGLAHDAPVDDAPTQPIVKTRARKATSVTKAPVGPMTTPREAAIVNPETPRPYRTRRLKAED